MNLDAFIGALGQDQQALGQERQDHQHQEPFPNLLGIIGRAPGFFLGDGDGDGPEQLAHFIGLKRRQRILAELEQVYGELDELRRLVDES